MIEENHYEKYSVYLSIMFRDRTCSFDSDDYAIPMDERLISKMEADIRGRLPLD
jgi:hypothetical protein